MGGVSESDQKLGNSNFEESEENEESTAATDAKKMDEYRDEDNEETIKSAEVLINDMDNVISEEARAEVLPTRKITGSKSTGKRMPSVRFRDLIKTANQGRRNCKKNCSASKKNDRSSSSCNSKNSMETSSSEEIQKTVQIGLSIGYQLQGEELLVGAILDGEGDKIKSK
ncbi:hypothetical protein L2E82_30337 [Cichorium intybus]|uniref:Uncharacterized protein n=1 Tax=Cichorium intybus TaxID=13427 RepID=A0ACB9D035_CICIN|nr:hypothetical protein L2E82_30337 [Cichorium intybus]